MKRFKISFWYALEEKFSSIVYAVDEIRALVLAIEEHKPTFQHWVTECGSEVRIRLF